ncbi:MAG TPA: TonB family protein [Candidatus Sulfotelmatobacter sp.]|jgi:TonB family protein
MPPPDSTNQTPSWNRQPLTGGSSAFSLESYSDVAQVAKTLSELGGGAVALDLALDLVLNEVVEQARLATGAAAASIILERDGEMVCRATTGEHAPELGMKVETESGLSGECLRTGEVQNCADTETDTRVDAEACRQLGIRSVLLVPLQDGEKRFGIVEVFSSRPNAFGERDINTLQALAGRIIRSKQAAERGSAGTVLVSSPSTALSEPPVVMENPHQPPDLSEAKERDPERTEGLDDTVGPSRPMEASSEIEQDALVQTQEPGSSEIWTTILVVLVIAAAISLGVVIGWRGALQGTAQSPSARDSAPNPTSQSSSAELRPEPASSVPSGDSEASRRPAMGNGASKPNILSQRKQSTAGNLTAPSSGGLTVIENGKVIYRLGAAPIPGNGSVTNQDTEASGTRLLRRVDPDYPEQARKNRIQGAVVLNVQVLGDGNVGNIEIAAGNPVLAEAAVHAVKQWKYQPYAVDGRPVQSQTRITIRFTLPSS